LHNSKWEDGFMLKREVALLVIVCCALLGGAYAMLSLHWYIGYAILGFSVIPIGAALVSRISLKRIIPDLIFGAIDTGLLTIPAVIGGWFYGVVGAIGGGVVGDAVTDGIAGFFEGGVARWLRSRGIDESRTPMGSALGKMAGCLLGAGIVLSLLALSGIAYLPQGIK
jgi:hypothetical protein